MPVYHLDVKIFDSRHWTPGSFGIELAPSGEVTRNGDAPLGPAYVAPAVRESLRKLITRERFFALPEEHGTCYIDGRMRSILVTLDGRQHHMVICDVDKGGREPPHTARALRVWYGVLLALTDAGAIWTEKADQAVLDRNKP